MKSQHTKASTFANHTSRHINQSLQKSLLFAIADKIVFKKFPTLQKNKKRNPQPTLKNTQTQH